MDTFFVCKCGKKLYLSGAKIQRLQCSNCGTSYLVEYERSYPLGEPLKIEGRAK